MNTKENTTITELPFQTGLKKFLNRKGLTQKALADKIYVAPCTVSQWSRGGYDPSVTVSLLILEGMTLEEIFGAEVMDRILENEKESTNAILRHINAQSSPKKEEPKKETRAEKQKAGFMSRLAMLFSAKR